MADKHSELSHRNIAKESHLFMERLVERDHLTGLPNELGIKKNMLVKFSEASRSNRSLVIAKIDIKFFKAFDELFSWEDGNQCLANLARKFTNHHNPKALRASDFAGRKGGDDFVVAAEVDDIPGARKVLDKINGIGDELHAELGRVYGNRFNQIVQQERPRVLNSLRLPSDYSNKITWNSNGLVVLKTGGMYLHPYETTVMSRNYDIEELWNQIEKITDRLGSIAKDVPGTYSTCILVNRDYQELHV